MDQPFRSVFFLHCTDFNSELIFFFFTFSIISVCSEQPGFPSKTLWLHDSLQLTWTEAAVMRFLHDMMLDFCCDRWTWVSSRLPLNFLTFCLHREKHCCSSLLTRFLTFPLGDFVPAGLLSAAAALPRTSQRPQEWLKNNKQVRPRSLKTRHQFWVSLNAQRRTSAEISSRFWGLHVILNTKNT